MHHQNQAGSKIEPSPERVGRHRRANGRPRITAEQAGKVLRTATSLIRAAEEVTKHKTSAVDVMNALTEAVVQVWDVCSSIFAG